MAKILRVNVASESDVSVQGHGVHTAFEEQLSALEKQPGVEVVRGQLGKKIDCDVVHLHTIGMRTWRKLFQASPKKVVTAHVVPDSFVGSIVLAKYWKFAAVWYMRWFYNRADKVLAVSGMVARILKDDLGVPADKIAIFYNSIDMSRYRVSGSEKAAARQRLGIAEDKFVVLGNGQVQPRKRIDLFAKMAQQSPDIEFIWVGGIPFKKLGADYAKMQKLISAAPDNLRITGVIEHEKVRDYLAAADVFCLPAEQENHPMCVLEAAGASLPIIVRDISEYDDTFGQDVFRAKNDEGFLEAIETLRRDKDAYLYWQKAAGRVADRFDSSAAAKRLIEIYRELVV